MSDDSVWNGDRLNRKGDAEFLINFLPHRVAELKKIGRTGSFVLNVDAEWGQGKSFFIHRFRDELRAAQHPVVFIDAWQDDFADDPFTAVMAEIDAFISPLIKQSATAGEKLKEHYEALKNNFTTIVVKSAKGAVEKLAKKVIGDAFDDVAEILANKAIDAETAKEVAEGAAEPVEELSGELFDKYSERLLKDFKSSKESLNNFRQNLEILLKTLQTEVSEYRLPFYIIVDELDRCRPTYAIAMLERIKHLFDVPDLVFVLSTDTRQLAESVKAVYGSGFNGTGYLQRFFSQTYELPRAERSQIISDFFANSGVDVQKLSVPQIGEDNLTQFIASADTFFGLEVRDLLNCLDILHTVTTGWQYKCPIVVPLIFPLIVGFKRRWQIDNFSKHSHWFGAAKDEEGNYIDWKIGNRSFDMMAFAQVIKSALSSGLAKYLNSTEQPNYSQNYAGAYAYEILMAEMNATRNGGPSHMLRYPDLIRRAGQLR